jgi:polygalacturonase
MKRTFLSALALCICSAALASSTITTRPDDPKAVYVNAPAVDVDSSDALQAAIDKAESSAREGIVFIPAGHYTRGRSMCGLGCD